MATRNEQAFETIEVRLPAELLARVRAEAERRGTDTSAFIADTLAAGVAQAEDDMGTLNAILHGRKVPEEKAEFQSWVRSFFGRYDQALRNLAK